MEFKVTHRNPFGKGNPQRYCGPTALSALTGYTAECAGAWINFNRRRPAYYQTRGTYFRELRNAGLCMGVEFERVDLREWVAAGGPTTFNRFARELSGGGRFFRLSHLPLLVGETGHWTAIKNGMIVDSGASASKEGIPLREHKSKRVRVHNAWICKRVRKLRKREPLPDFNRKTGLPRQHRNDEAPPALANLLRF